jgi:hypothetical protein
MLVGVLLKAQNHSVDLKLSEEGDRTISNTAVETPETPYKRYEAVNTSQSQKGKT